MEDRTPELIKHREIGFRPLHPDPNQAQSAMLLFSDVEGVLRTHAPEPTLLLISYDIRLINLQIIETTLLELGFHLDNSLLLMLKRALYYYTEDTQYANLGCDRRLVSPNMEVFINRYERLQHGCRDDRPEHWRKYL